MNETIEIRFSNDELKTYPKKTTYYEISQERKHFYQGDILAAKVDNNIVELDKEARSCNLEFIDLSTKEGHYIYEKGLSFLFVNAARDILHKEAVIRIENSIDKGIYVEIDNSPLSRRIVDKIEKAMLELVEKDLEFKKISVLRTDAIKYFESINRDDKVRNLKFSANSYVSLYKFNNEYDYFYSKMPKSSKAINKFKLHFISRHGLVINYPKMYNPLEVEEYEHHKLIADKFNEYSDWASEIMDVGNSADLNEKISKGKIGDLIRVSETLAENSLMKIAHTIYSKREKIKVVLLAGPSSSGKTTTSKKLTLYLKSMGLKPHQVSLDDYFKDRKDTPKDKEGNNDYESINAIDLELFNKHLALLLQNEKVKLPTYNFIKGKKEFDTEALKLEENGILVIEGLHCLNEELTKVIEKENKYKIYISPLTQLNIDNYNYVHTTDVRLLRRIVRDNKYRGYSPSKTLEIWKKVRQGEEKYIFPYQDEANIIYNSALIYEIGVLKTYVEPLLFSVEETDPNYIENNRLIKFLNNFLPIPSDEVPTDSIVREFIGGSCFRK